MESEQNNTDNMTTGTQQQQQRQPEHVPTVAQSSATGPPNTIPTAATATAPAVSRILVPSIKVEDGVASQRNMGGSSPRSSGTRKRPAPSSTTDLHDNSMSSAEAAELLTSNSNISNISGSSHSNGKPEQQSAGGATLSRVGKDGEPLSEKKLRRLEKNRLSARECRRRKREATENMQGQINLLEGENLRLRLQLQVGEEAEQTNHQKQIDSTKALGELLKSGKASESEIYAKIEEYKEKFADYGRDRRSAMEFHLRNVERLLMPTQTTSFIMNTLKDSDNSGSAAPAEPPPAPVPATSMEVVPSFPEAVVSGKHPKTSKELFTLLVKKLEVTSVQAAALKDSRFVAQEMDETLKETFNVLKELRGRLAQCGQDLETEFNCIRQILTPSQSAKFLVWVAQNKACMHMLNELWSKNYPSMTTSTTGSPPTTPTGSGSFDE